MAERLACRLLGIGHGDAILLRVDTEEGTWTALVDGGKAPRLLRERLLANGINRIDLLVLTHFNQDHIGGLEDVASVLEVGSYWAPVLQAFDRHYWRFGSRIQGPLERAKALQEALAGRGADVIHPLEGYTAAPLGPDGPQLQVLSPPARLIRELLVRSDLGSFLNGTLMPLGWLLEPVPPAGEQRLEILELEERLRRGYLEPGDVPDSLADRIPASGTTEPEFFGDPIVNNTSLGAVGRRADRRHRQVHPVDRRSRELDLSVRAAPEGTAGRPAESEPSRRPRLAGEAAGVRLDDDLDSSEGGGSERLRRARAAAQRVPRRRDQVGKLGLLHDPAARGARARPSGGHDIVLRCLPLRARNTGHLRCHRRQRHHSGPRCLPRRSSGARSSDRPSAARRRPEPDCRAPVRERTASPREVGEQAAGFDASGTRGHRLPRALRQRHDRLSEGDLQLFWPRVAAAVAERWHCFSKEKQVLFSPASDLEQLGAHMLSLLELRSDGTFSLRLDSDVALAAIPLLVTAREASEHGVDKWKVMAALKPWLNVKSSGWSSDALADAQRPLHGAVRQNW